MKQFFSFLLFAAITWSSSAQLAPVDTQGFSTTLDTCRSWDITPGFSSGIQNGCVRARNGVYVSGKKPGEETETLYYVTANGTQPVIDPVTGEPMKNVRSLRSGHDEFGLTNRVSGHVRNVDPQTGGVTSEYVFSVMNGDATVEHHLAIEQGVYPQERIQYAPLTVGNKTWWLYVDQTSANSGAWRWRSSDGYVSEEVPIGGCPNGWTCSPKEITVLPNGVIAFHLDSPPWRYSFLDTNSRQIDPGPEFPYTVTMSPLTYQFFLDGTFVAHGGPAGSQAYHRIESSGMTPIPWAAGSDPAFMGAIADGTIWVTDRRYTPNLGYWKLDLASNTWARIADAPDLAGAGPQMVGLGNVVLAYVPPTLSFQVIQSDGIIADLAIPNTTYAFIDFDGGRTLELDGWLYFLMTVSDGNGKNLWRTDGSVVEIVDAVAGGGTLSDAGREARSIIGVSDGKVLIEAMDPYESEIWAYTPGASGGGGGGGGGTSPTTTELTAFNPGEPQVAWSIDNTMPADSGFVFGPNMYGDAAKAQFFEMPDANGGVVNSVDVTWAYKASSVPQGASYTVSIFDGTESDGPLGSALGQMAFAVADIAADSDTGSDEVPMSYVFDPPVAVGSGFFAVVDFGAYSSDMIGTVAMAAGDFAGSRVDGVWEKWGDGTWANVSDAWLNGTNGWPLLMSAQVSYGAGVDVETVTELPSGIKLAPPWPNPFNPQTTIEWTMDAPGPVEIVVYDVLGRSVRRLVDAPQQAGVHTAVLDASGLSSGLYIIRLQSGNVVRTQKALLLK